MIFEIIPKDGGSNRMVTKKAKRQISLVNRNLDSVRNNIAASKDINIA